MIEHDSSAAFREALANSLDLPHPLHLFAMLTGSRHYHLGFFANGCAKGEPSLAAGMDRLSARCLDWLAPRSRVLDVGCGLGGTLALLAERGHAAVGVDPCAESIASARSALKSRGSRLYSCDFLELRALLPAERFDALILIEASHRFESPRAVLAAARSLLVPEGLLLVQDVVLNDTTRSPAVPFHPRGAFERAATEAGFGVLQQTYLTAHVAPTLGLLEARLAAGRSELIEQFRGSRPGIAAEIDELQVHMGRLAEAFEARDLVYEEVALRVQP